MMRGMLILGLLVGMVGTVGAEALSSGGGAVLCEAAGAYPKDHCVAGTPIEHTGLRFPLKDKKGGDPSEWPTDLRVREFPKVTKEGA